MSKTTLSCPICLEVYDLPKSLNCGHSFCEDCISPCIANGRLTCPECRKPMKVPNGGLVTNFALNRLTEEMSGINLVSVTKSDMSGEMETAAKRIILKAVNNSSGEKGTAKKRSEIAESISNKFNAKYGKYWQCFVLEKEMQKYASFTVFYKPEHYIEAALDYHITIFKSSPEQSCWKCGGNVCDGKNCNLGEAKVLGKDTDRNKDPAMIEEAKRIVIQAIREKESYFHIARFIKKHFNSKYGKFWSCNVAEQGSAGWGIRYEQDSYIDMKIEYSESTNSKTFTEIVSTRIYCILYKVTQ